MSAVQDFMVDQFGGEEAMKVMPIGQIQCVILGLMILVLMYFKNKIEKKFFPLYLTLQK
jgi:uncharacterized PurR-regulated membrane protein YhhQ (DUF165 family)